MRWVILLLAAVQVASAGQSAWKREGGYWVRTSSGVVPAGEVRVFKLITSGGAALRGGAQRQVTYTIRMKVRARTEAAAETILATVRVTPKSVRDVAGLWIQQPAAHPAFIDVEVQVPRGLRSAVVSTKGGNVSATGLDGDVHVETAGGTIDLDQIGGSAFAKTGGGEIKVGSVRGSLRCTSAGGSIRAARVGAESWLETAGGEISVAESQGPVHASTNGGNILVERSGSYVTAQTAGGRIEVQQARGIVNAENNGGSIEVGTADGVRAESSGGGIRLRGTSGALRAATDVGNILAELVGGVQLKDSLLSSGAGDITVFIPSNLALTVKAQNETGRSARVVSEFPELRRQAEATMAVGALNGGGPVLTISAAGTIYLRRIR